MDDEIPLGQLYQSRRVVCPIGYPPRTCSLINHAQATKIRLPEVAITIGREELTDLTLPAYTSVAPPPYSKHDSSRPSDQIHKIARIVVSLDFVANLVLLIVSLIVYLSSSSTNSTDGFFILIPSLLFLSSIFGNDAFGKQRVARMTLFSIWFFARWSGDLAIALYVYSTGQQDLFYNLPLFSYLTYLPVVGSKCFDYLVFPCISSATTSCGGVTGYNIVNSPISFVLVLIPQLAAASFIVYDCWLMNKASFC